MWRLRHTESTTKIKWYSGYSGWNNEGGYRWFDLILHFAKARDNRANRHPGQQTSTIIFVSNGSGTETDETDSYTDATNEGKQDSDVMNSKTDTANECEVWDSFRIILNWKFEINMETINNEEKIMLKNIKGKQREKQEHY